MNIMKGMYIAVLMFIASFMLSWLSSLIFSNNFAIMNSIMSTMMKSSPYNACGMNELGLFATKVVIYGIKENANINNMFNQIILELILFTWL